MNAIVTRSLFPLDSCRSFDAQSRRGGQATRAAKLLLLTSCRAQVALVFTVNDGGAFHVLLRTPSLAIRVGSPAYCLLARV